MSLHNRNNNHTKSNVTYYPLPHHHLYDVIPLVILPMHKLQGTLMTQVRDHNDHNNIDENCDNKD